MVSIKHFKDGDRLVVVFEGLEAVTESDIVKNYLQSMGTVSQAPPAQAEKVAAVKEDAPVQKYSEGPYKDKTPVEVFAGTVEESEKALKYLSSACSHPCELKEESIAACRNYLQNRYSSCDAKAYAEKLSEKQIKYFLSFHDAFIDEEIRTEIASKTRRVNYSQFLLSDVELLRKGVEICIKKFQS